jgi:DNA-directed RNA polymerase subunit RPC12/RpoP
MTHPTQNGPADVPDDLPLDDRRWWRLLMQCDDCHAEWLDFFPDGAVALRCPDCGARIALVGTPDDDDAL